MWPVSGAHEVFLRTNFLFEIMLDSQEVLKIVRRVPTLLPPASGGHSQDAASLGARASAIAALRGQTCDGVPPQDGLPRAPGPSATIPTPSGHSGVLRGCQRVLLKQLYDSTGPFEMAIGSVSVVPRRPPPPLSPASAVDFLFRAGGTPGHASDVGQAAVHEAWAFQCLVANEAAAGAGRVVP